MTRRELAWIPVAALLAGCGSGGDGGEDPTLVASRKRGEKPTAVASRLSLRSFDSCQALEKWVEDGLVEEMKVALDRLAQEGVPVFRGAPGAALPTAAPAPSGAAPAADSAGSTAAAPTDVTRTNNQVAGVDEADFVKNDGERIFVLSGRRLHATQSWPPQALSYKGGLEIEGQPREMFLDEQRKRVIVMSQIFTAQDTPTSGGGGVAPGGAPTTTTTVAQPLVACPAIADARLGAPCGGGGLSTTKVTIVDASRLEALAVLDSYYVPGAYHAARMIDGAVRLVLTDQFQPPPEVRYYPDVTDPAILSDKQRLAAALEPVKIKNEELIRARTLDQWIPKPRLRRVGDQVVDLGYDCRDFNHTNAPVRLGMVTVATLDLAAGTPAIARTTVMAEAGQVYASRSNLYVASPHWWWWPEAGQYDFTYLYRFDITRRDRATFVASGGVEGRVVDQFSLDEHADHLRVATTTNTWTGDARTGLRTETTNQVLVLRTTNDLLAVVGRTEALAKGERIYSARFMGARGYVVTFRQVDPLFTFDLSIPAQPRKVGELKVPGFSTYIHPLGDRHLLTIGVNTVEVGGGVRQAGLKLSMFDVGDLASPREVFTHIVGTSSAGSEALNEHKAFNYFEKRKLLAIPFVDYGARSTNYWSSFVSELRVYDIDVVKGITLRGAVPMGDVFQRNGSNGWGPSYSPWVRRSVMATDDVNDFVYAISDAGVRVANAKALATPLATAVFPLQR